MLLHCTQKGQIHSDIALSHRVPVQLLNVHKDPHQLGDRHGWVGVIQLDGHLEEESFIDLPPAKEILRHFYQLGQLNVHPGPTKMPLKFELRGNLSDMGKSHFTLTVEKTHTDR